MLGLYECRVALHPEVIVTVTFNVARSEGEAKAQAAGESFVTDAEEKPEEEAPPEEAEPKVKKKKKKAKTAKEDAGKSETAGDGEETEKPAEDSPAEASEEAQGDKDESAD